MNKVRLILLLSALLLLFCGCGKQQMEPESVSGPELADHGQLYCLAEDQVSAEEIAELYGISLIEFGDGVAIFSTEEDPNAVIEKGQANGWPVLSLNTVGSYT